MSSKKKLVHKSYDLEHVMVLIVLAVILVAIVLPRDGSNIGGEAKKTTKPTGLDPIKYKANFVSNGISNLLSGQTYKFFTCIQNWGSVAWKDGEGYALELRNSPDIYGMNKFDLFRYFEDKSPLLNTGYTVGRCFYFPININAVPGSYNFGWQLTKNGMDVPGGYTGTTISVLGPTEPLDAPGPYIGAGYNPIDAKKPYLITEQGGADKIVMALFHYNYGLESGEASRFAHHPIDTPDYHSVAWFENQVKKMVDAGIDIILPVYGGYPEENYPDNVWANEGLSNLVVALQNLQQQGQSVPKIGMYFDTHLLATKASNVPYGNSRYAYAVDNGWKMIRNFFSLVPPSLRAQFKSIPGGYPELYYGGNLIVVGPRQSTAFDRDSGVFYDSAQTFGRTFGGEKMYPVFDMDLAMGNGNANIPYGMTKFGAALDGLNPQLTSIVQIGPGFDETNNLPQGATPRVRDRENGEFYLRNLGAVVGAVNPKRMMILETWNNYYEGSELDETSEYGRQYITLTRAFVDKWRGAKDDAVIAAKVPGTMNLGSSYTITVTVQNSGNTSWSEELGYNLAVLEANWGVSRVDLASADSIVPGSSKTFTFSVVAPSTAGKYPLTLQMMQELGSYKVSFGKAPSTGKKAAKVVDATTMVTVKALPPQKCKKDADCPGQKCVDKVCQSVAPPATSGLCGGIGESCCVSGETCKVGLSCVNGVCQSAQSPPVCGNGQCESGETSQSCPNDCVTAPSCTDRIKNQGESDVDCGGSCKNCKDGKACVKNADCSSNNCVQGICKVAVQVVSHPVCASKGGKCPDERGGVKQCGSGTHRVDGSDCYWCCIPN